MSDASKERILVVEDDPRMLDLLCKGLREIGHTVMPASDGEAGLELATRFDFEAIVLDIGLPHRDGYDVMRALRAQKRTVPILMLTARDTENDIIHGFDLGADDYLTKPFSFREMLARVHGLTRLARRKNKQNLLILDPVRLTVLRGNTEIQLTRTEFLLLASLNRQAGAPVTRQSLAESIWGTQSPSQSNTLEVLVNALRGKLDAACRTKMILTVRGVGYRLQMDSIGSETETHGLSA
jgi:DNA-binding response OmpR family regulator